MFTVSRLFSPPMAAQRRGLHQRSARCRQPREPVQGLPLSPGRPGQAVGRVSEVAVLCRDTPQRPGSQGADGRCPEVHRPGLGDLWLLRPPSFCWGQDLRHRGLAGCGPWWLATVRGRWTADGTATLDLKHVPRASCKVSAPFLKNHVLTRLPAIFCSIYIQM